MYFTHQLRTDIKMSAALKELGIPVLYVVKSAAGKVL